MEKSEHHITNKPKGNEWLWLSLTTELSRDGGNPSHLLELLYDAVSKEIWEERGLTFQQFIVQPFPDGIESSEEQIKVIIQLKHKFEFDDSKAKEMEWLRRKIKELLTMELGNHGGDRYSDNFQGSDHYLENKNLKQERDKSYIERRLKTQCPRIWQAYLNGQYKSARQAGIAAGFIKKDKRIRVEFEPNKLANKIKQTLTIEQVTELIKLLQS